MNMKLLLPVGLLLGVGIAVADAQTAEKIYDCYVKDSKGQPVGGHVLFAHFHVTASNVQDAESKALANANKKHGNTATSATCTEKGPERMR